MVFEQAIFSALHISGIWPPLRTERASVDAEVIALQLLPRVSRISSALAGC
jgi:hypothetical protein